jgi:hypothetical protein
MELGVVWHMLTIPALKRQRQEDFKLKASLGYTASPCLKKQKQNKEKCLHH